MERSPEIGQRPRLRGRSPSSVSACRAWRDYGRLFSRRFAGRLIAPAPRRRCGALTRTIRRTSVPLQSLRPREPVGWEEAWGRGPRTWGWPYLVLGDEPAILARPRKNISRCRRAIQISHLSRTMRTRSLKEEPVGFRPSLSWRNNWMHNAFPQTSSGEKMSNSLGQLPSPVARAAHPFYPG